MAVSTGWYTGGMASELDTGQDGAEPSPIFLWAHRDLPHVDIERLPPQQERFRRLALCQVKRFEMVRKWQVEDEVFGSGRCLCVELCLVGWDWLDLCGLWGGQSDGVRNRLIPILLGGGESDSLLSPSSSSIAMSIPHGSQSIGSGSGCVWDTMWTFSIRVMNGRSSIGSSSLSLGSRPYRLYGERDGVEETGVREDDSDEIGERWSAFGGVEESEVSELEQDMVRCGMRWSVGTVSGLRRISSWHVRQVRWTGWKLADGQRVAQCFSR